MNDIKNNNENKSKGYKNYLEFGSLGFTLIFSVFFGLIIGIFIDKKLNTIPLFTILFLIAGITLGFINSFRILKKSDKKKKSP